MTLKIIAGKYDSVTRDNKRKTRGKQEENKRKTRGKQEENKRKTRGITELNLKFDGTGRET
jgi:hypothetical protein